MGTKAECGAKAARRFFWGAGLIVGGVLLLQSMAHAQGWQAPARPIGKISTEGNLIVMELDEGVLGKANLFDLVGHTLRFIPDRQGYRVENVPLQWDPEFGAALSGSQVTLHNFKFPFSAKEWDAFSVGRTGSISFDGQDGVPERAGVARLGQDAAEGGRGGGLSIGRFEQLSQAARTIINTVPAICVFLKPRMSGPRYIKEAIDHVVITWDLTEPAGGIQDFTWLKTTNRFQAVLRQDGVIEMSYDQVAAKDAIVGLYPVVRQGTEQVLATLAGARNPSLAPHLNVQKMQLAVVDNVLLEVKLETRGPVLLEGDPALPGVTYRVVFDTHNVPAKRPSGTEAATQADVVWTVRGVGQGRGARGSATSRYFATGAGASPRVKVSGNTISIQGILPAALKGVDRLAVSAEVIAPGDPPATVDSIPPRVVKLSGIRGPEVDLSSLTRQDGPFTIVYESFHYLALPNPRDMACTVLKALGDRFDFLAHYSDFRVDNQEAGTPSNGPLGGNVTGIGATATQRGLESYCTSGRFQWQFIQPVYVGSNQMQERPPDGLTGTSRDVAFYARQLGERSPDAKMLGYNLAMSQLGHEMGHRWSAFVSAKVNGEIIPLGPTHWARGLQAPAAFPYQRPVEASAMGGGVWQDNFDGTYTQLDDDYYVPATGWSYLDLYLMGLITPEEVPDFFLLKNLMAAGRDTNGHPIFKADRVKITIQDVIAAEGPRLPAVDQSQKNFNTGIVLVVEHGKKPSRELVERANGIRERWIDYWGTTTGHRSSMTVNAQPLASGAQGNQDSVRPAGLSK